MINMLKLITRNLFNKKQTRLFPLANERPAFERFRGRINLNPDTCILCSICAKRCPADAIMVDRKEGNWKLDPLRCIICGECATACPKNSIIMNNDRRHAQDSKEIIIHKVEIPVPAPKPAAKTAVSKPIEVDVETKSEKPQLDINKISKTA